MVQVSVDDKFSGTSVKYDALNMQDTINYISSVKASGIKKIYLQYLPSSSENPYKRTDEFATIIEKIKKKHSDIELIIDPIGLAINDNLQYGVRDKDNESVDALQTLDLLAYAASKFADAGANGFLTLGRINHEVATVKQAFSIKTNPPKIFSFSTNSETSFAYFAKVVKDPTKADTGQKLKVGNHDEMLTRALIDIYEGTNVLLQKPIENFAMFTKFKELQNNKQALVNFLNKDSVKFYLSKYNPIYGKGLLNLDNQSIDDFFTTLAKVELGGYEVSGACIIQDMIQDNYSEGLAHTLQNERYLTAQSASENSMRYIVGRNMQRFAKYEAKNLSQVH